MKSRLFLNLFMLLILISLASFALFYQASDQQPQRLTQLDIKQINHITIPREKQSIELQKIHNSWQMLAPYKVPAHDFRIQQLLKLSQLQSEKIYLANQLDLSQFSLDKPRARIRFNDVWVELGSSNPVNQKRYIKSGNIVMLQYDDSYPLIRSQPSSFVNLSLLGEQAQIKKIKLPQQTIEKISNSWQLTPDRHITADAIQAFIQNWQMANAFAIHPYLKRKQLGLIEISLRDKKIIFEITDKKPWLILARKDLGIEYHLDASMNDRLLQLHDNKQTDE